MPAVLARYALSVLFILGGASRADAYIGPGAGFALLSSFLVLFTTVLLALVSLAAWPFRFVLRAGRRRRRLKPLVRRLVIVGFDGQDPKLTERLMQEGRLPNFARLAAAGGYQRLRTTFPSVSPVAWSTFSTGVQPGRHNIFDFLDRDLRTYLPVLSSTRIGAVGRALKLGRFRVPLVSPDIRMLRKSRSFWCILGDHDIWSTVLRVPVSFPPEKFYGAELSAMAVPDLLGTQGTFTLFTTRSLSERFEEGGTRVRLRRDADRLHASLEGPPNPFLEKHAALTVPLAIRPDRDARRAHVDLGGFSGALQVGELSGWITVAFSAAPMIKISGVCRLLLSEAGEHVSLYVSAINIDPERPAMPISHPHYYATYLAKKIGPYATLGMAEDTWALNEGVIDERAFLTQTYDIDAERERMFLAALERLRQGTLITVFDATDRIQHMFWRYLDAEHPSGGDRLLSEHRGAVEDLYVHNDARIGRIMSRLEPDDVLMVLSDHGFSSFRRGVNLNAWLRASGYLTLMPDADERAEWLRGVDWSRTRAYALGLTGLFLNLKGREGQGIVEPGEPAAQLKRELAAELSGLVDPETTGTAISEVFDTRTLYAGPYAENAPDLLIGYNAGYRTSWGSAKGVVAGPVFEDNLKAWSGDHCIDPRQVPGVLFCNRPIQTPDPGLIDIAPTALALFGIDPPAYMEGHVLAMGEAPAALQPA